MLRRTWILIALLTISPAAARELVEPLRLTGRPTLRIDAPPLGSSGTVELFLSADPPRTDGGPANQIEYVLSNANADAIRFGVMLRADRKELGLTNGVQFVWLPAPLADGEFHHIVIATSRGLTEVSVDGASLGVVPLAFGSAGGWDLEVRRRYSCRSPLGPSSVGRRGDTALDRLLPPGG
ncbi:MAG: hypothetical protein NT069_19495 [Planctomycetota bacterium]|nr:hypothetical protein [Planctomycetota bacterium]